MTIEVVQNDDKSFTITWDENDPQESILNEWTEQDFIDAIVQEAKITLEKNRVQKNPDEFVLEDVKMVHYEVMTPESSWIGIYLNNGKIYHLNISGTDLNVLYSNETP